MSLKSHKPSFVKIDQAKVFIIVCIHTKSVAQIQVGKTNYNLRK